MGNSTSSNKAAAANLKKNGILAEHLVGMLEMIKKISQATTLSHATSLDVEEACKMMGCDRSTVFVVDKINEQFNISSTVVHGFRALIIVLRSSPNQLLQVPLNGGK